LYAIPPPAPPRVNAGLMIAGKPILFNAISASANFSMITDLGHFIPNFPYSF
tara:strand:+ start:46 stop:201 length:156 start_codon:yes stop_codon:yes gene_type:complete